jgi:hypothetical protein
MRDIVLGPTFEVELAGSADEGERALGDWIRSGECPYDAARAGSHFTMTIRPRERHFWSPVMNLEVLETNGRTVAAGRFNPSNGIWAGFMLTALALATIAIGASMWGTAELILGRTPWSLALIPACLVVGGVMFWASALGQRIARPEMEGMKTAVRGVLGAAVKRNQ